MLVIYWFKFELKNCGEEILTSSGYRTMNIVSSSKTACCQIIIVWIFFFRRLLLLFAVCVIFASLLFSVVFFCITRRCNTCPYPQRIHGIVMKSIYRLIGDQKYEYEYCLIACVLFIVGKLEQNLTSSFLIFSFWFFCCSYLEIEIIFTLLFGMGVDETENKLYVDLARFLNVFILCCVLCEW